MRLALLSCLLALPAFAQTGESSPARSNPVDQGWHFSAESDPVDFLSHGYALYLGVKPPDPAQWRFGVGTFALDFPGFAVDLAANEPGWSVRAPWSALGYASRYFSPDRRGLFLGARAFVTRLQYHYSGRAGEDDELHAFIGPEIGYQWFPFEKLGLYVTPWVGLQVDVFRSADAHIQDKVFSGGRLLPLAFIYFGYEI